MHELDLSDPQAMMDLMRRAEESGDTSALERLCAQLEPRLMQTMRSQAKGFAGTGKLKGAGGVEGWHFSSRCSCSQSID
jgi:hypothetical protein